MIEDLWYKNTIIYSLDLDTFMDANGDGVGDFEGLVRRLDYLHSLGVETVWLAPFQPSPNRDNGYDVMDYYGVDPRHGSSGDFVEFMHQANKRGIKVIIDLVVNHTSDQHPWFQAARHSKDSRYRNWYVWSETRPLAWNLGMIFPGVQEAIWTYDKEAGEYYFHRFYEHMPDLNTDNPDVRTEIRRIMGYWLELGVAGFRVDAAPFLIETPPIDDKAIEYRFEFLAEMRKFLQWRRGDAILLAEANVAPEENLDYFGAQGQGIQMMFNFHVNQRLFYTLATGDTPPLAAALEATRTLPDGAQWAHFLRNHDELDLGRLSQDQRAAVLARFGPEARMQLYERGLRRRLAPMLGDRRHLELAYSLLFALPGTPVIRYGDEIGMGEDLNLNERDSVRTPMQWSDEAHAGFSAAPKTVCPVIAEGEYDYKQVNVEAQRRNPHSLLNWTGQMIRLRKECPEIGWGTWEILPTGSAKVLALRYDWRGTSLVTIHNFDDRPHEIEIKPNCRGEARLINLLAEEESAADAQGQYKILLEAYGYRWYRVGSLNYAIRRVKM
ncbi:MAG: alpha-amylase family protein [Acidobacteria bacterium]|nr:alpha-amylase family protein [Acidobacteriota bacterium]MBI3422372.1 alpha-amylase family protein [Acidobacteriota bacterium]